MGTPIFAADDVVEAAAYTVDDEVEPEDVVEQFREFIDSVNPDDFGS
jgi:bifunctional DNase/RNase